MVESTVYLSSGASLKVLSPRMLTKSENAMQSSMDLREDMWSDAVTTDGGRVSYLDRNQIIGIVWREVHDGPSIPD